MFTLHLVFDDSNVFCYTNDNCYETKDVKKKLIIEKNKITWVPRQLSIMWVSSLAANMGNREHST